MLSISQKCAACIHALICVTMSYNSCDPLLPIVWHYRQFVSLRSTGELSQLMAPTCGTTFHPISHLHRHSQFSDNISRYFYSPSHTQTFSFDLGLYIFLHHLWTCIIHYLDHIENYPMMMISISITWLYHLQTDILLTIPFPRPVAYILEDNGSCRKATVFLTGLKTRCMAMTQLLLLSAASRTAAADYVLVVSVCPSVCLCVTLSCKQYISETNLRAFEKVVADTPCILS